MKRKSMLNKSAFTLSALALLVALVPAQTIQAAAQGLSGRIVTTSSIDGNSEIYSYKIDGSDARRLTNTVASEITPRWSFDGTKIVFVSERDGNREIYTMNGDGTNQTRVTNNSIPDQQPTWSPDGTKIAFNSQLGGSQDIWLVNADGTNLFQVTNVAGQTEQSPDWSPDGTKILYRGNEPSLPYRYYTIHPDGTNRVTFTDTNTTDNATPRWSPDSTKIVFNSTRAGNQEIHTINADGTNIINISNNAAIDSYPSWTPEGKIAFNSDRSGAVLGYVMDANGSNQALLSSSFINDIQSLTITPRTINQQPIIDATKGPITYNAPTNHTDTYEEIDPTSVTITTQPQKGTITVSETTGEITYTQTKQASRSSILASLDNIFFKPASAQSVNQDSFTYQICSTANSQLCTSATVRVNLASAATLASTGSNLPNLVAISSIGLLAASAIWVIRKKHFI